jgi:hypothetical protein
MKNKLSDLNDHLFAQMESLNDEDNKGEELQEEIKRSSAVSNIAKQIISNANLVLQAEKAKANGQIDNVPESMRIESK